MPSLGKHDPLVFKAVDKNRVSEARRLAETVLEVSGKRIQFDNISRQRMKDVIASMGPLDKVSWRFYDNSEVELNKVEMEALFQKCEAAIGPRIRQVFARASELKARIEAGEFVSERDIHLDSWA